MMNDVIVIEWVNLVVGAILTVLGESLDQQTEALKQASQSESLKRKLRKEMQSLALKPVSFILGMDRVIKETNFNA